MTKFKLRQEESVEEDKDDNINDGDISDDDKKEAENDSVFGDDDGEAAIKTQGLYLEDIAKGKILK